MRIMLISGLYPPYMAGAAEMYAGLIAESLKDRGHEVTVLTSWNGLKGPQTGAGVLRLLRFYPSQRLDSASSIFSKLRAVYLYHRCHNSPHNGGVVWAALRNTRPDLVYLFEPSGLGINSILRAISNSHVPLVIHLHDYWLLYLKHPMVGQSECTNLRLKKILIGPVPVFEHSSMISVSQTVKDEHVRAGFAGDSIEVIHNGVPPSHVAGTPIVFGESQPRFLYAGRLVGEKGVHVAVSAVAHMVKMRGSCQVHLDIVGDGYASYVQQLRDLAEMLGVEANITLLGKVDRKALLESFGGYAAMLVPSLWKEPFATTVLEAMAVGLPVIASRLGGHSEIIVDGKNGFLFEPGNAEQLAVKMDCLLHTPELRAQISLNALQTAAEELGYESFIDKIEKHLERALSTASTPRVDGPVTCPTGPVAA